MADATLTVEQLAAESGMTVRNIRNHQSRGLLPPPEVRARTGYYGREHVARLRLIRELQADGLKLAAIEKLLGEHGGSAEHFVGLRRAITAPFETDTPEVLTADELVLRAAEEVSKRGVPLDAALSAMEDVKRGSQSIARTFVDLFLAEVWRPFDGEGRPDERWDEITETIERLRPLASEVVVAMFKQSMAAEAEDAFGKLLSRQGAR